MLLQPKYMARFRQVASVLIRHGFSDVLAHLDLHRLLSGKERAPTAPLERQHSRGRHLCLALTELGPTYIKLGQVLSTRPDILPQAYLDELESLQDRVPPFEFKVVRATVVEELGRPLEEVFASFDETPIASASLAQVHRATLRDDVAVASPFRTVAVKVLRPGVEQSIELELDLLTEVADLAARTTIGQPYDPSGVVDQLRSTLRNELVLRQEGRNARHFAGALAEFKRIRVPGIVDELTTRRLLVMEFMDGIRFADAKPREIPPGLADELWRAYLKQILVDGLFHCDPHPGNVLLDHDGRIVLLDFGMVATLTRETRSRLLTLLLWLADGDGEHAAEACLDFGIAGRDFDERKFKAEIGLLVTRFAERGLNDLALGNALHELVRIARHHNVHLPSELTLFGKTVLNLEGICRKLDPDLEPVKAIEEMAGGLLASQLRRELTRPRALAAALEARSLVAEVPATVRRVLRRVAANDLTISLRVEGEEDLKQAIQKIASRITLGLITAALIVASALVLNVEGGPVVWGYPLFALVGFLLAASLGIYLVLKIILADRE